MRQNISKMSTPIFKIILMNRWKVYCRIKLKSSFPDNFSHMFDVDTSTSFVSLISLLGCEMIHVLYETNDVSHEGRDSFEESNYLYNNESAFRWQKIYKYNVTVVWYCLFREMWSLRVPLRCIILSSSWKIPMVVGGKIVGRRWKTWRRREQNYSAVNVSELWRWKRVSIFLSFPNISSFGGIFVRLSIVG